MQSSNKGATEHEGLRAREVAHKRRSRLSRRSTFCTLLAMGLTGNGMLVVRAAASSEISNAAKTPLQKGLAFYSGKTITFLAGTSAGSPADISCQAIATAMGNYLHATVNLVAISAGAGIPAEDQLASSSPNGLTIGLLNMGSIYNDIISNLQSVNFNPLHEVIIGGHPNNYSIIMSSSTSQYKTFASLLNSTPSNPIGIGATPGGSESAAELFVRIFGIHASFVNYANTAAVITGFDRGDTPLSATPYTNFSAQLDSGSDVAVAVLSSAKIPTTEPGYSVLKNAPTVGELVKKYPPKVASQRDAFNYLSVINSVPTFALDAPAATPPDEVAALDAAAASALRSSSIKSLLVALGNTPGYVAPRAIKSAYASALKYAPKIAALFKS